MSTQFVTRPIRALISVSPVLKRSFSALLMAFLTACASLPTNVHSVYSAASENTSDTVLSQSVEKRRRQQGIDNAQTGMYLLGDGVDAFVARLALVRLAEKTLDVQYYLYHSDLSGKLLTAELWKAAERGVQVRMLLDDMDTAGHDKDLAILSAHANIQIRLFNPFVRGKSRTGQFVTRFGSVTRRAHNKALIADNAIAIIGGRNIGDAYFNADPNLSFGDLDVALTQPAANEVSNAFDLYWNNTLAYPIETLAQDKPTQEELHQVEDRFAAFYEANKDGEYLTRLTHSEILRRAREGKTQYHWGDAVVLYDHPDKISSDRDSTYFHLAPKLAPFIRSATQELLVISPYFVPGKEGVEFFSAMEQRGVDVKIITNSLTSNDVPIVHAGYSKYRKALLEAGVQLYELDKTALGDSFERDKSRKSREGLAGSKASLHAKYFVIDRSSAFIGSFNFDPRSVTENTEIGVVINQRDLAEELAKHSDDRIREVAFEVTLNDGDLVWIKHQVDGSVITIDKEPHSTLWDRFSVWFMSLLPVESQL